MAKYQGNNIIFRIASSDAISKFKAVQAHSFLQLTRKELDFESSTREVVLLEYERLSTWIFKMEKIFQTVSDKTVPDILKQSIIESFKEEIYMIEHVASSYPDTFDGLVVSFTRLIHKYSFGIILDRMEEAMADKVDRSFTTVVSIVSDYLQHLLVCFHEYNNNVVKRNDPFVCVADFCIKGIEGPKRFVPVTSRLKFFEDNLEIHSFIAKNYSSSPNILNELNSDLALESEIVLIPESFDSKIANNSYA